MGHGPPRRAPGVTYPISIFHLAAGAGVLVDPQDPGRGLVVEGTARFLLKLPDIDKTSYSFLIEGLGRGALRGEAEMSNRTATQSGPGCHSGCAKYPPISTATSR